MPAKHTPTPWKRAATCIISDVTGEIIAERVAPASDESSEHAANAAFIVKACNCHEELVQAAQDALQSLKRLPDRAGAWRVTCIIQLEAALAKAKSKGQP